ncbi:hypothetical protein C8R46DRAFT_1030668 [Mycena filopes]|nr:hypothetical protein C8R46DRAFT_1030668 [Mycena filopes]
MPKAAKLPVTPRPRDEGILVEHKNLANEDGYDEPIVGLSEDSYETDFINDGDPFEDVGPEGYDLLESSPFITPPPSPVKAQRTVKSDAVEAKQALAELTCCLWRTSYSAVVDNTVIEVESTSEKSVVMLPMCGLNLTLSTGTPNKGIFRDSAKGALKVWGNYALCLRNLPLPSVRNMTAMDDNAR